jgi:large subunit ribosomal protein L24
MQATKPVKDPRKQRKQLFNAPAHLRHKLMSAPLSAELVASRGAKTLPVRKGDTVRVMRGDHKGFEGKISRVDLKNYRVYVEGLTREKVDGTAIFLPVHPSKVMIRNLSLDDKWRKAAIERKQELPKEEEKKVAKKPAEKAAKVKKEKPVEAKAVVPEKVKAEKKPAKKKPGIEKKAVEKKPAAKKKKEEKPPEEAKPVAKEKETKAKAPTKKTPVKSKRTVEKEGGA